MELLEILRLQLEWGADEALLEAAQDRRASGPPSPAVVARAVRAAAPAGLLAGPAQAAAMADGCATLEELRGALENFSGCDLRDTATRLVFADGAESARLMLIGEAPGAEEDRIGRPFVGPAGQLLDKMLASIGLDRTQLRIANVIPWRPPGNRNPTEREIAVCLPFLLRHIALARPECVVLLGGVAAKALLPAELAGSGIRRLRGQWLRLEIPGMAAPVACLPTYHPAYLLRTAAAKRESWHDLVALREWMEKS
jgi:DNA polymerase